MHRVSLVTSTPQISLQGRNENHSRSDAEYGVENLCYHKQFDKFEMEMCRYRRKVRFPWSRDGGELCIEVVERLNARSQDSVKRVDQDSEHGVPFQSDEARSEKQERSDNQRIIPRENAHPPKPRAEP